MHGAKAYWSPAGPLPPLQASGGRGGWVTSDGCEYFEGSSGLLNLNLGHAHPRVLDGLAAAQRGLSFAHPGWILPKQARMLSDELLEFVGLRDFSVIYTGSGTDAVEAGLSLARQYHQERNAPKKTGILSRRMSYHGSSYECLRLSGHWRRQLFAPFLSSEPAVCAPYCFRCPVGLDRRSCGASCVESFQRAIDDSSGAERFAAVLVEPIGGSGCGAIEPVRPYYHRLREFCDVNDLLLIADEVMCGLGRTGDATALAAHGVVPDILVVGKGLGAGYVDVSAVLVRNHVRTVIETGSGITPSVHTYTASPSGMAAGRAVLAAIREELLLENVRRLEPVLVLGLEQMRSNHPSVLDVRGRGFLHMVELSDMAGPDCTRILLRAARLERLLLYPCNGFLEGRRGHGFFVAPPLNTTEAEIDFLLGALDLALRRLEQKLDCPEARGDVRQHCR